MIPKSQPDLPLQDLSGRKSLSYFNSDLPPVYPNAWVPVAYSSAIEGDNQIYESVLCGQDIVLFRDKNSNVVCLDAYCPHLGANLAAGGRLTTRNSETCIQCPFHGWSFNGRGDCVDIPYNCSKGNLLNDIRRWSLDHHDNLKIPSR